MLKIKAQVKSRKGAHEVNLQTNNNAFSIKIAPKATGYGSSVNGGELLLLALADECCCCCRDRGQQARLR